MIRKTHVLLGLMLTGAAGWYGSRNKAGILNLLTPKHGFDSYTDIAYGDAPRQQLDVYVPKKVSVSKAQAKIQHGKRPVVVFVHGGSWNTGCKEDYVFLAESLTSAGFIAVVINYHLAQDGGVYPRFVADTAQAIGWCAQHIASFGGDPDLLFAMGHSAGAFNVVAAANTPLFFEDLGLPAQTVKAVVGIAGPYSFDFRVDPTAYAFPYAGDPEQIMPDRLVRSHPVPHLLLTAQRDTVVKHYNTDDMAAALVRQGGDVQVSRIASANHVSIIAAFSRRLQHIADTRQQVLDYLSSFL